MEASSHAHLLSFSAFHLSEPELEQDPLKGLVIHPKILSAVAAATYHTATTEMVNGFMGIKGAWELGGQGHRSDWRQRHRGPQEFLMELSPNPHRKWILVVIAVMSLTGLNR